MRLGIKESKEMYDTMFRHIQAETHLTYGNRLYNYAFRDNQCIEKGKYCTIQIMVQEDFQKASYPCFVNVVIQFICVKL